MKRMKHEPVLSLQKARFILHSQVFQMVFAALCLSMGLVLPGFFHMMGGAGAVFLPMHIPALLCGFICGWRYGLLCGMLMPILSSVITSMLPLFPKAVAMSFELAAYGAAAGLTHSRLGIYPSLILSMVAGRLLSGAANFFLLGCKGIPYGWEAFLSSSFIVAIPGIILQLLLIPALVKIIEKVAVVREK